MKVCANSQRPKSHFKKLSHWRSISRNKRVQNLKRNGSNFSSQSSSSKMQNDPKADYKQYEFQTPILKKPQKLMDSQYNSDKDEGEEELENIIVWKRESQTWK